MSQTSDNLEAASDREISRRKRSETGEHSLGQICWPSGFVGFRFGLKKLLCFGGSEVRHNAKSIRPFIGAKDFKISRQFYSDLGFDESVVSESMSLFRVGQLGFYLQNACVKDWVDNTMLFLEVDDVERHWMELKTLDLPGRYRNVRLTSIRIEPWGKEYFLHDPSGILWHFGEFRK